MSLQLPPPLHPALPPGSGQPVKLSGCLSPLRLRGLVKPCTYSPLPGPSRVTRHLPLAEGGNNKSRWPPISSSHQPSRKRPVVYVCAAVQAVLSRHVKTLWLDFHGVNVTISCSNCWVSKKKKKNVTKMYKCTMTAKVYLRLGRKRQNKDPW